MTDKVDGNKLHAMAFCIEMGEIVTLRGVNSDRKVLICKAGVGTEGKTTNDQPVNYCPFFTLLAAKDDCNSFKSSEKENIPADEPEIEL